MKKYNIYKMATDIPTDIGSLKFKFSCKFQDMKIPNPDPVTPIMKYLASRLSSFFKLSESICLFNVML